MPGGCGRRPVAARRRRRAVDEAGAARGLARRPPAGDAARAASAIAAAHRVALAAAASGGPRRAGPRRMDGQLPVRRPDQPVAVALLDRRLPGVPARVDGDDVAGLDRRSSHPERAGVVLAGREREERDRGRPSARRGSSSIRVPAGSTAVRPAGAEPQDLALPVGAVARVLTVSTTSGRARRRGPSRSPGAPSRRRSTSAQSSSSSSATPSWTVPAASRNAGDVRVVVADVRAALGEPAPGRRPPASCARPGRRA